MFSVFRAALTAAALGAATPAIADCRVDAAELDLAAKTRFQRDFFETVVVERPSLTEIARDNRDLQIAMAKSRRMKVAYLVEVDPDRLITDKGLSAFANFDWSRGDERKLRAADADYDAQAETISTLLAANQQHPDWPALRFWAREDPKGRALVTSLAVALRDRQKEASQALAACP